MVNIALVVLDTLRYDVFERNFDWLHGRTYTRAFSTSNWTVPAHVSLLFGELARHSDSFQRLPKLPSDDGYLPVVANSHGYRTIGLSANSFISTDFGWEKGFDYFHELPRWAPGSEQGDEGDKIGARKAVNLVEDISSSTSTFLYINLMGTHWPYTTTRSVEVPELDPVDAVCGTVSHPEAVRDAYETAATELSHRCRPLLAELQTEFDYIFVTSDHGELLGEYDYWTHEYGLHPELVRVPLHVIGDGLSGTDAELTTHQDIYSTIRGLLSGRKQSSRYPMFTGDRRRRYCLTECFGISKTLGADLHSTGESSSWIDAHRQPIVGVAGQEGYLYQHLNEVKGSPVTGVDQEVLAEVALGDPRDPKGTGELNEARREQLEALGYR